MLPLHHVFVIENLREVKTKFGQRFIVDLRDMGTVFVPDDNNDWLIKNTKQVKLMMGLVKDKKIWFKRIGGSVAECVDPTLKRPDSVDSDMETVVDDKEYLAADVEMIEHEAEEGEEKVDEVEDGGDEDIVHIKWFLHINNYIGSLNCT